MCCGLCVYVFGFCMPDAPCCSRRALLLLFDPVAFGIMLGRLRLPYPVDSCDLYPTLDPTYPTLPR